MTTVRIATLVTLLATAAASQAAFFTDEATFGTATATGAYTEDFTSFTFGSPLNGTQTSYDAPGANGFDWTATVGTATDNGLYANNSSLSTNTSNRPIVFTFTGSAVTAFGARLSNTSVTGAFIPGTVTMTITGGDGGTQSLVVGAAEGFIGYTSATAIASVSVSATSTATNNWIQADHVITGAAAQPVPEPATMAALGFGALALLRRRKAAK